MFLCFFVFLHNNKTHGGVKDMNGLSADTVIDNKDLENVRTDIP